MGAMLARDHWIGNRRVESSAADRLQLFDPATGEPIGSIPAGSAEDARAAVDAACAAFPAWSTLSIEQRCEALIGAQARLMERLDAICELEVLEVGHVMGMARTLIESSIQQLERFCGYAREALATELSGAGSVIREPYGPTAIITPWNLPILILMRSMAPALVAGNTVVVKPSERSPFSTDELVSHLGLPEGVVNVLHGDARSGAALVEDPRIRLAVHTGSVASGRAVAEASGRAMRPCILELGGKDPVIVDEGVDLDWAARFVAEGAYINTGQVCTSMERIYVLRSIADEFVDRLVDVTRSYVVGPGSDPKSTIGPLIDDRQRRIVEAHVRDAVEKGATVRIGGSAPERPGTYFEPTVLTGVTHDMVVMREETFGPLAPVQVVDTFEEAVALANDTEFGLAATVLTQDQEHMAAAAAIKAGVVWINQWHTSCDGDRHEPRGLSGLGAVGDPVAVLHAVSTPKLVRVDGL